MQDATTWLSIIQHPCRTAVPDCEVCKCRRFRWIWPHR